jgi:hypothetical protein
MPKATIDLRGLPIGFGLALVVGSVTVAVCGVVGVLHLEVVGLARCGCLWESTGATT